MCADFSFEDTQLSGAVSHISGIVSTLSSLINEVSAMSTDMGTPTYNFMAAADKRDALERLNKVKSAAGEMQRALEHAVSNLPNGSRQNAFDINSTLSSMETGNPFSSPTWVNRDYGNFSGYTPTQAASSPNMERAGDGGMNILSGALLILGGVAAVAFAVGTLGAGTPATVGYFGFAAGTVGSYAAAAAVAGVGAAGVVSTAMGGADAIEGVQHVIHGVSGNNDAIAWHPIRDTVFKGNEDWYYSTEMGVGLISTYGVATLAPFSNLTYRDSKIVRTKQLDHNKLQGKKFENRAFKEFSKNYSDAQRQVSVRTPSGIRLKLDAIGKDANGNVVIGEFKSSVTAPLTPNQKLGFPEISGRGALVVGTGKGPFSTNYIIQPTKPLIIRPGGK